MLTVARLMSRAVLDDAWNVALTVIDPPTGMLVVPLGTPEIENCPASVPPSVIPPDGMTSGPVPVFLIVIGSALLDPPPRGSLKILRDGTEICGVLVLAVRP